MDIDKLYEAFRKDSDLDPAVTTHAGMVKAAMRFALENERFTRMQSVQTFSTDKDFQS